jgi:hypothetical protein
MISNLIIDTKYVPLTYSKPGHDVKYETIQ